jgi:hypothetical protein
MRRHLIFAGTLCVGFLSLSLIDCGQGQKKAPTPAKKEVASTKAEAAPTPVCVPYIYVVTEADHKRGLTGIAEKVYGGRGYMWPVFLEVNEIPDPNLILAGIDTILIPCLCDLQPLVKNVNKHVVRKIAKVTPKVKAVPATEPMPCPVCPPILEPAKISAVPTPAVSADVKVTPTEAPKPPPAPAAPALAPQPVAQLPLTPTGFWAGPGNCGTGQINLSWNLTLEANTYKIYRDGVLVHTTNALVWADTGLVAGKGYRYTIAGSNAVGDSPLGVTSPAVIMAPEACLVLPEHPSYHEDAKIVPPGTPSFHGDISSGRPTDQGKPVTSDIKVKSGDDGVFTGSLWNVIQHSPLEKGVVDYFHIDQGYVFSKFEFGKVRVGPYVSLNVVKGTEGRQYPWKNRVETEFGVRFVRPLSHGVIEAGTAYSVEERFSLRPSARSGFIGFLGGWEGWNLPNRQPPPRTFLPGTFPGSFQYRLGNLSPFEPLNVIGSVRLDQGITLAKVRGISFIPSGTVWLMGDTDKNAWNRRLLYGAVMKGAMPFKSGIVEVQGGYMCAKQYSGPSIFGTSSRACGPSLGLVLWTGWSRK